MDLMDPKVLQLEQIHAEKDTELEEKWVGLEEHCCGTVREGETVVEYKSSKHANICRAGILAGKIFLQSSFPEATGAGEMKRRFVGTCCSVLLGSTVLMLTLLLCCSASVRERVPWCSKAK